ncbi:hypothetical protein K491DRAFT_440830 [Lophiostoma macrostomum CBS 122681]|uniref:Uncharacterized protein n=1 Tax=Lophiostoma macrostomum CBS 122681 TaxID=1314788 RepID=A0A6A6T7Q9_9PLEO|nr:hypothetical protein K491DRAFT_440830 [Lophiostoma macrostomum CBS 122681]
MLDTVETAGCGRICRQPEVPAIIARYRKDQPSPRIAPMAEFPLGIRGRSGRHLIGVSRTAPARPSGTRHGLDGLYVEPHTLRPGSAAGINLGPPRFCTQPARPRRRLSLIVFIRQSGLDTPRRRKNLLCLQPFRPTSPLAATALLAGLSLAPFCFSCRCPHESRPWLKRMVASRLLGVDSARSNCSHMFLPLVPLHL